MSKSLYEKINSFFLQYESEHVMFESTALLKLAKLQYAFLWLFLMEGSNMIFHSLTFARSRGKC